MKNEKKITIEISEKLYNLFLEQTSDESRRKFLEPEDWDDIEDLEKEKSRIEQELNKKISFEEFVWDTLDDINYVSEVNNSLSEQLGIEMNIVNHPPYCECVQCEESRRVWVEEEEERKELVSDDGDY